MRAIGLDLRPEMIEFAKAEAAREGVVAEWIAAKAGIETSGLTLAAALTTR